MSVSNLTTTLRTGICTSTSRPTAPYEGQMIYETDTDLFRFWDGAAWKICGGNMPTCIIRTTTAQTGIGLDVWTQATFPSTITDINRGGFTVSGGAITIPSGMGGIYHVAGQMQWDSNSTGLRGAAFATTSALNVSIVSYVAATGGSYMRCAFSGIASLTAGVSYCVSLVQSGSGGARSTDPAYMPNTLSLTMLSP